MDHMQYATNMPDILYPAHESNQSSKVLHKDPHSQHSKQLSQHCRAGTCTAAGPAGFTHVLCQAYVAEVQLI